MRDEVIFSCLLLTVCGMTIQKRNAEVEEIYVKHNDSGMKTRYEFNDIRISNRRKQLIMRDEVIFSCLLLTVCGMAFQKRNADEEEIYGRHNDCGMKTRYEISDIRISNRRKRWSIGSGNSGDHNSANGNQNIGNTNTKKSKHTNVIDARNEKNFGRKRRLKICKKWSIGSNYTGDGNTADNNTNIDNKNKITNEIEVGNFEHSEQKSDWSIGSNNEGNKHSANGNTNICNKQKHSHKNTNVFKVRNVRNNGKKNGWSYKRKRARKVNNRG